MLENQGGRHHQAAGELNAVKEEGRVVGDPGEGKLDKVGFFAADDVFVGRIAIEKVGGVLEAVLEEVIQGARAEFGGGRAPTPRLASGEIFYEGNGFCEFVAFFFRSEAFAPAAGIGVMGDFVAGIENFTNDGAVALDDHAGDEEGAVEIVPSQEIEDARNAFAVALGALGKGGGAEHVVSV